jgi:hypothetical protein
VANLLLLPPASSARKSVKWESWDKTEATAKAFPTAYQQILPAPPGRATGAGLGQGAIRHVNALSSRKSSGQAFCQFVWFCSTEV